MLSLPNPVALELSVLIGVDLCVCTNAYNFFYIGIVIWALWKNPPTSASAADAMTCRSVVYSTNISPFLKKLSIVCGVFVRR